MAAGLDRDVLMFRAGARSAGHGRWTWPAVCAFLTLFAFQMGIEWGTPRRSEPPHRGELVRVPPASPGPPPAPARDARAEQHASAVGGADRFGPMPRESYARLKQEVVRWGLDALPNPAPVAASLDSSPTLQSLLEAADSDTSDLPRAGSRTRRTE